MRLRSSVGSCTSFETAGVASSSDSGSDAESVSAVEAEEDADCSTSDMSSSLSDSSLVRPALRYAEAMLCAAKVGGSV